MLENLENITGETETKSENAKKSNVTIKWIGARKSITAVSIVRKKWGIVLMIKKCPVCGKEFETPYYLTKYCSDKCREEVNRQKRLKKRKGPELITCPTCGKSFWRRNSNHKYCSPECAREAQRIRDREYYKIRRNQKEIDTCMVKHNYCYDCPEEAEYCPYD